MTSFDLLSGPRHVRESTPTRMTGYYSAEFADSRDGSRRLRFLTERGRAELLDRMDGGQRAFSAQELDEMTVRADFEALEARYQAEAGVGG